MNAIYIHTFKRIVLRLHHVTSLSNMAPSFLWV